MGLADQVKQNWGTPRVPTNNGYSSNPENENCRLEDQVQKNWPTPTASEVGKACKGQNQASLIKMALNGHLNEDNNNTTGKPKGQLNPEWVAQLMGTTLEQRCYANTVTELSHKPQK